MLQEVLWVGGAWRRDHREEQGGDSGGDQGHRGGGTPLHTKVLLPRLMILGLVLEL